MNQDLPIMLVHKDDSDLRIVANREGLLELRLLAERVAFNKSGNGDAEIFNEAGGRRRLTIERID